MRDFVDGGRIGEGGEIGLGVFGCEVAGHAGDVYEAATGADEGEDRLGCEEGAVDEGCSN